MDESKIVGRIDLHASGNAIVHLEGRTPFTLSHLQAIDVYEVVREQARLDQRKRDRERLVSERLANISFRPQIGILQSED